MLIRSEKHGKKARTKVYRVTSAEKGEPENGLKEPQALERERILIKKCYDEKLFAYYSDTLFSNNTQQLYILTIF